MFKIGASDPTHTTTSQIGSAVELERIPSRRAFFSFRSIKYFLVFLLAWQQSQVLGSIFQVDTFLPIYGPLSATEFYLLLLGIVCIAERTVTKDYHLRRSYFSAPICLFLFGLFISWCRGVLVTERYAVFYEAHEAFLLPFALLVIRNCFEEKTDRNALFTIIIIAPLFKCLDGLWIYAFSSDPHKEWGVIQMWRDGYLLGIGVLCVMLFLHYKSVDRPRIRTIVLWGSPIIILVLLLSVRRTFMISGLVSAVAMLFSLPRERRLKQFAVIFGTLVLFFLLIILIDPIKFFGRLSGIVDPTEEGSAFIRLLELPNVIQNILHNPIWGTPVGTEWIRYFRMPKSAVYTTLGTHNTYLYYPLRAGILGFVGFFWLLARMWKSALINRALARTEDDEFLAQFGIQLLVIYQTACFFGIMYGDAMSTLMGLILVAFQLQSEHLSGLRSYVHVNLLATLQEGRIIYSNFPKRFGDWIFRGRFPKLLPLSDGIP